MSLRGRPFSLCHCEAIRRRPRQSHRPHSYLRVRGDCFLAALLAMTCLVAPFFLSHCESAPGGAVFPMSLPAITFLPHVIARPSPGGRGNLSVPIYTYEYPRDCFVAALLAMTYNFPVPRNDIIRARHCKPRRTLIIPHINRATLYSYYLLT